ncbi:MAG: MgtC/SapB family protein [Acetobacter fabarum]|jgi:putative Mg2+ transporter-C (MgtC) family protein|uniref:MgtC/SapB family protein n=1 Tax=Acetobacter fabarum TaxID=483199 RepID=UPI002431EE05|nr:MgtC/SapB family protein [Acetobacter fabarum]MCH4024766.1 MgtC/SapB family protein [Acetobacter fabarum]MCH4084792.1 MgtC/SapB family protein [Acetobacter fabarum]MCH4137965.1 MgtC/SapB family protein [Acetobacter fabarum]
MTAEHGFWDTALALSVSFVLGAIIGLERQYRQRTAGLRTNVLVAVGAAAFVDLGIRMGGADGSVRVIAYVVSGIGFLGAGVIMKDGGQVRGLNTAATLWSTAAVGAFSGTGLPSEATLVALFILAGNTLLRPLVAFVDRRPLRPDTTEALYRMHVVCRPEHVSAARDLLADELEHHHYPIQDIETLSEGDDYVELAALLVPTSADLKELDTVSEHIAQSPDVISATWSVSTTN